MREIKFRYYHNADKRMYEVLSVSSRFSDEDFNRVFIAKESLPGEPANLKDDSKNGFLMQFTGLKDSKGVDIYEGDIVSCFLQSPVRVCFHDGAFGYWLYEKKTYTYFISFAGNINFEWKNGTSNHIEKVGNIYEHPEGRKVILLEVDKENYIRFVSGQDYTVEVRYINMTAATGIKILNKIEA